MMDLDEDDWEYLPDAAAFLDDAAAALTIPVRSLPSVFNMDHFSTTTVNDNNNDNSLPQVFLPLTFPPSPTLRARDVVHRLLLTQPEQEQEAVNINNTQDDDAAATAAASDMVFFKSSFAKESIESVDMKFLDSTSSPTATSPRRSVFDDLLNDDAVSKSLTMIKSADHDVNWIGEGIIGDDYAIDESDDDDDGGIFNLWKLGFGGIGAICSFGVAAATICLILFGNNHKAKQNQKLRFQIYSASDDQRMKQAVQQATKFNEAMSVAVRGVPLNRAHITYGGYYDNSL